MKISLIAPTYLPSRRANTIQVMKMAQAIATTGHVVRIYVPNPQGKPAATWEELSAHYGLNQPFDVEWIHCTPRLRSYDYAFKAVRHARRDGADLVYTRLPQAATLAGLRGIPTVFEIHDLPRGWMGERLFSSFVLSPEARRLVVITDALWQDIRAEFGGLIDAGIHVIAPDGVDMDRYQDLPDPMTARRLLHEKLPLPERFTAGYTGHLYPGRGIDVILALAERVPDVNFLLAGGNPQEVERHRQIAQSRGLDNLFFAGFIPNRDLPTYQAACDVLLMPYQRQVAASSGGDIGAYLSPMKVFEYLASSRAILSSDLPVLQEVLTAENAVLLPPNDLSAWVNALVRLRDDPALRQRLACQAQQDVEQYTWERRVEKIFSGLSIDD